MGKEELSIGDSSERLKLTRSVVRVVVQMPDARQRHGFLVCKPNQGPAWGYVELIELSLRVACSW